MVLHSSAQHARCCNLHRQKPRTAISTSVTRWPQSFRNVFQNSIQFWETNWQLEQPESDAKLHLQGRERDWKPAQACQRLPWDRKKWPQATVLCSRILNVWNFSIAMTRHSSGPTKSTAWWRVRYDRVSFVLDSADSFFISDSIKDFYTFIHCLYCCGQYQRALNLIKENNFHQVSISKTNRLVHFDWRLVSLSEKHPVQVSRRQVPRKMTEFRGCAQLSKVTPFLLKGRFQRIRPGTRSAEWRWDRRHREASVWCNDREHIWIQHQR